MKDIFYNKGFVLAMIAGFAAGALDGFCKMLGVIPELIKGKDVSGTILAFFILTVLMLVFTALWIRWFKKLRTFDD